MLTLSSILYLAFVKRGCAKFLKAEKLSETFSSTLISDWQHIHSLQAVRKPWILYFCLLVIFQVMLSIKNVESEERMLLCVSYDNPQCILFVKMMQKWESCLFLQVKQYDFVDLSKEIKLATVTLYSMNYFKAE